MILPIIAAAIASMIVGSFWYSPYGFGKPWMALMNITPESMKNGSKKKMYTAYVANFIGALVQSTVFAFILTNGNVQGAGQGVVMGIIIWLGFQATIFLGSVIWENKPIKLALINAGNNLVTLIVTGSIIAASIS